MPLFYATLLPLLITPLRHCHYAIDIIDYYAITPLLLIMTFSLLMMPLITPLLPLLMTLLIIDGHYAIDAIIIDTCQIHYYY
jgi:hypothetical protein